MRGAIPPLPPRMSSWSGDQLKHSDNFTFTNTYLYLRVRSVLFPSMFPIKCHDDPYDRTIPVLPFNG